MKGFAFFSQEKEDPVRPGEGGDAQLWPYDHTGTGTHPAVHAHR